MGDEKTFPVELLSSIVIALVTSLLLTTSIGHVIVKPLLLDGTLISDGRYAFVYDAHESTPASLRGGRGCRGEVVGGHARRGAEHLRPNMARL